MSIELPEEFMELARQRTRKILAALPALGYNVGEVVALAYLLGAKDVEAVTGATAEPTFRVPKDSRRRRVKRG